MKRLILSLLAGFIATAALSLATDHVFHVTGIYPPYGEPMFDTGLLLLASAYRVVFQIFGAYLTAMIAKDKANKAVWILGTLGAILWLVGTIVGQELGPLWYGILGAALSIPTTLTGGRLYEYRAKQGLQEGT